jgi:CheY-like chemotaxis protein
MARHSACDAPVETEPMPTPRLLVADDNPTSLRFFVDALGDLAACTTAQDGAEALRAGLTHAFDLLLLDARMPVLGGAAVLEALRGEAGPSRGAPALATTAEPGSGAHAALLAAGFAAVLSKPIGVRALRDAVAARLGIVASGTALDEEHALAAAGGDAGIVAALRVLLAGELDALPGEVAAIDAGRDADALHERLHRLDASAGFCGVPMLATASASLRRALADCAPEWPREAIGLFLSDVACARDCLRRAAHLSGSQAPASSTMRGDRPRRDGG